MAGAPVDRYAWLDEVIARISLVYAEDFTLVPAGRAEDYNEKHGSCLKCTYQFVFREGAHQALPNEDGDRLMKLIRQASKIAKADPPLVPTVVKRQRDFADWGWTVDGAEMWVFLEVPKGSAKPRMDGLRPIPE